MIVVSVLGTRTLSEYLGGSDDLLFVVSDVRVVPYSPEYHLLHENDVRCYEESGYDIDGLDPSLVHRLLHEQPQTDEFLHEGEHLHGYVEVEAELVADDEGVRLLRRVVLLAQRLANAMQQDRDCLNSYEPQAVEDESVALAQVVGEALAAVVVILKYSC